MHIPDNYLSPQTCAVMTAAMIPVWTGAVRKIKKEVPKEKIPMLGVGAAFSFTGMMFNIPLPGGTTGHAVGGTLLSILLGPEAACISITIALLIQALLFGDGGILSFGANCFNMAFVLPYSGYACWCLLNKLHVNRYVAAGISSYIGINMAALFAGIEFGIQPILFHDQAGQALYCPYGLSVSIPAMMAGHLTLFGAAEVVFTVAIYAFLLMQVPDIIAKPGNADTSGEVLSDKRPVKSRKHSVARPIYALLALMICAVPLGLLANGTAWGEWAPQAVGIKKKFAFASLLPDYSAEGLPDFAGYILSAVIGVSLLIIIFRLISAKAKGGSR